MAHHSRRDSVSSPTTDTELDWPFGKLEGIDRDDVRETAYEIFFTACRSSPGFGGGRNAITFYSNHDNNNNGGSGDGSSGGSGSGSPGGRANSVVTTPASRIKRALGLKMLRRSPSRRMSSIGSGISGHGGSAPSSPNSHGSGSSPGSGFSTVPPPLRPRRPLTSAEIMRQQMRVTEQSDNRLRKTLMRTLVGQMGRRAETIILPLELLRHLKPSEFNDSHEYHLWQKRQLKIIEAGLLLHPSIPLDKSNTYAMRLREIIRASETKPIDTGKNSDTTRTLCNSVVSLSWRSANGTPTDVCHWADGFPLNIHLYISLLQSIFDIRDETLVLDEVDELLELMKKTWSTLGINRPIHNLCFTWVLFQQYVVTGQTEPDLLCAAHAMLTEVANYAKKPDWDVVYVKMLSSALNLMHGWAEKRLLQYHDYFHRGNAGLIESLLPLVLSASKILGEDVTITEGKGKDKGDTKVVDSSGDRIDHYIRSSVKNAFAKVIENENAKCEAAEVKEEASEALLRLAKETEDLALKERESFSPILKKWHPIAASVAAVTLHQCYGVVLKQYLAGTTTLTNETVGVLQRAAKLEKVLVQMVVEDSTDCDDGGKSIVREMDPYEVDSIILRLLRQWIEERLKTWMEYLNRAKESETWNPKSKTEPYALSIVELIKLAKEAVDDFFQIPIGITEDLVHDLADALEHLFQEYTSFVASCGTKQSYIPILPPLTRCNRDSKFLRLWKRASPCSVSGDEMHTIGVNEGHHPRPSTSRGTQRLYIRLNTLHYLLSHLHSLDKTLALSPKITTSTRHRFGNGRRKRANSSCSYFDFAQSAILSACQHVSEVAAYRLIFLDSNSVFYESLYVGDVANSRGRPALRTLKQNITLLSAIITDRAQALAVKEVMKASFEAYLMVLLAGGCSRVFHRSDHEMIVEDFESLKRVFCTCGEGLVSEDVVDREAETVEGVITLMGECSEQLMEDFSIATCETSGIGVVSAGQKLPMPPTTGRWNRSDPNTILRVLCYRNDRAANQFLKRTFQLAKRR
ncbi:protein unc-13 homolog [Tripterygium wilfordii]|uniref:protein unc-13 homolog n=1 Tax=Tripterygium wilfordii TaxID=458696 RepID=UPI0018F85A82|nr:protein unc-13 homolog [Tripterygium wilfordii]XP_038723205.1 protein unc-13 homolog [Tripterygium wilfordii]